MPTGCLSSVFFPPFSKSFTFSLGAFINNDKLTESYSARPFEAVYTYGIAKCEQADI